MQLVAISAVYKSFVVIQSTDLFSVVHFRDVAKRQAKYYQIKSKYYVLLRQHKDKKTPVAGIFD